MLAVAVATSPSRPSPRLHAAVAGVDVVTAEDLDRVVRGVCDKITDSLGTASIADAVSAAVQPMYADVAARMNAELDSA